MRREIRCHICYKDNQEDDVTLYTEGTELDFIESVAYAFRNQCSLHIHIVTEDKKIKSVIIPYEELKHCIITLERDDLCYEEVTEVTEDTRGLDDPRDVLRGV